MNHSPHQIHLRRNRLRRLRRRVVQINADVAQENADASAEDRNPSTLRMLDQLDRLKLREWELKRNAA